MFNNPKQKEPDVKPKQTLKRRQFKQAETVFYINEDNVVHEAVVVDARRYTRVMGNYGYAYIIRIVDLSLVGLAGGIIGKPRTIEVGEGRLHKINSKAREAINKAKKLESSAMKGYSKAARKTKGA